jgi:hypothetical protein
VKSEIEKHARKLRTPKAVQTFLRSLPYNREKRGETLRSAEYALRAGTAHCFEAAFVAAAILEHHGYPPTVMSFESQDGLDHVLFIYRENGKWGAVGRSRDEGLHGRPAIFRSPRALAWSYFDPYVDSTGRIEAYQIANLDDTKTDWRSGRAHVWKAEKYLLKLPHVKLPSSDRRYEKLLRAYKARGPMPPEKFWW